MTKSQTFEEASEILVKHFGQEAKETINELLPVVYKRFKKIQKLDSSSLALFAMPFITKKLERK